MWDPNSINRYYCATPFTGTSTANDNANTKANANDNINANANTKANPNDNINANANAKTKYYPYYVCTCNNYVTRKVRGMVAKESMWFKWKGKM